MDAQISKRRQKYMTGSQKDDCLFFMTELGRWNYAPLYTIITSWAMYFIRNISVAALYNADCRAEKSEREIYTGDENPDGLYDNAC